MIKRLALLLLFSFALVASAQPATTLTTSAVQTVTGAKTFSGTCKLLLAGSTSGTTCLAAPAIAGSTTAIVFPSTAGTLALAGADVAASQLTGTIACARLPALTGDLTSSSCATTFATVNSNVGTFGSATKASVVTVNGKGLVTAASESTVTPAVGSITGFGTGVATWLGTPTGANFVSILGCSGTANFLRADGTCAAPAGGTGSIGDVVGPASAVNNGVALFDGTTGKLLKDGGALATVATSGSASDLGTGTLPAGRLPAHTGDATSSAGSAALTLATVNANTGACGSATASCALTLNGKGLTTAATATTITPAVGSVTGLGTGVATALGVNVGSAGAPVVNGGVLGTPSSGVATNLTGTASGLTAGTATALANARTIAITGDLAYTAPSFDGSTNVTAAGTLATVNNTVGSFTNASVTVNAKGLVTAAATGTAPGGSGSGGHIINARLTLTSGTPVTTSDVTGATSIYWTPYKGNTVTLWDGFAWTQYTLTEVTIALGTLTNARPYDVFCYQNSGTPACEVLVWTSDTARATAVTLQDGRYAKSGDKTRLYVGTFRTTSTTTTEDSGGGTTTQVGGKRFLWNYYNRSVRFNAVKDTTATWSYTTDTIRQANAAAGNKVEFVVGIDEDVVEATLIAAVNLQTNSRGAKVGIGLDSTTAFAQFAGYGLSTDSSNPVFSAMTVPYGAYVGVGYHYLAWLERGADNNSTFQGGAASSQAGLTARIISSIRDSWMDSLAANDDEYTYRRAA